MLKRQLGQNYGGLLDYATNMVCCVQAASKALKEREAALLTLHAIQADLEKRRHAISAIQAEGSQVT